MFIMLTIETYEIDQGDFASTYKGGVLAVTSVGASSTPGLAPTAETDKNGFTGRMEERFRRRFEQE